MLYLIKKINFMYKFIQLNAIPILTAMLLIILDQTTKYYVIDMVADRDLYINSFLNIVLVGNHGISFGIFNNLGKTGNICLISVTSLIIIYLMYLYYQATYLKNNLQKYAILIIISGAIGNLIDRFVHNAVIDFIDIHWKNYHWPAFNIADSLICLGGLIIFYDSIRSEK